jgi:enediyne biosynthesis protein E4
MWRTISTVAAVAAVSLFGICAISSERRPPAQGEECLPQLTDIAKQAGITFRHVPVRQDQIVEEVSGGVLLLDYDRDGWPDIYFTNSPTMEMALAGKWPRMALYHNNHDGTFTDVTEQAGIAYPCAWPMGGAVGDYNNDGWPDIYVTCFGRNTLYRNNGNGTFTDVTEQSGTGDTRWSTGAAFGDYDGDGWADLFVANYVGLQWQDLPKLLHAPKCPYKGGVMIPCGPQGLPGAGDALFHNNGDGTFTEVSRSAGVSDPDGYYGLGAVWTDVNNDGRPDLYVANDSNPSFLYRNDGNGHFTDVGIEAGAALTGNGVAQASMGIALGDYLHTGRISLFVTNLEDEYNILYRNDGPFLFSDATESARLRLPRNPYVGWGTGFFDLDNDGWLDLFYVNGHLSPNVESIGNGTSYRQPAFLYRNRGNGTFENVSDRVGPAIKTPLVSRGCAFGDLFNRGKIDVVIETLDGSPMLLLNDGGAPNNWITLHLEGTKSNRLALGARVTVFAGGMQQTDEVRSGGGYLSQNDLRVHFGLGKAERVDRVQIRWPSTYVQEFRGLAVNRFYSVTEGAAAPANEVIGGGRPGK